ncbi:leucyl/phenylalanyl-tRNA--protein transferase [Desulfobacterales bacterium HSG2]|nr:leucyl/phenylalanyl-tRNA--protein transferase [Desulfobacterales bacterium HSG2]MDM8548554.1 leucyl/phenylalanyl-tRNA--protein transferase [Desulfobacterales bacterium HSG2]
MPVFLLSDKIGFPPPHLAREDGVLAVGGDLSEKRLLLAYKMGIFPWFSGDEPIIWWSPDPRLVLFPKDIHVSRSLKKTIRKGVFRLTMDTAFSRVITSCADIRVQNNEGTWIVDEMIEAYCKLHESGFAHSVEAWCDGELAGGLYGISLGKCFFGESMFSHVSNASKVAFVSLVEYLNALSFDMIDCQIKTQHLMSFGAREIPRKRFLMQLAKSLKSPTKRGKWGVKGLRVKS